MLVCVTLFLLELWTEGRNGLYESMGLVPVDFQAAFSGRGEGSRGLFRLITSLFIHVGWLHLIGNLLYLRVFGDTVEERFGHVGFLLVFLMGGAVGGIVECLVDPQSVLVIVGPSGAIAAVIGIYVVLYPTGKIVTLFPIVIILTFIEVPVLIFVGLWFAQQLLNGYLVLEGAPADGVAWFAHLGGFGFGVLVGVARRVIEARRRRAPPPRDDSIAE